jgi:hypothetical protein|tara:strand:- start:2081 stop:2299 length:219 start_codon:yes stop_codon:yes gene_type:complete
LLPAIVEVFGFGGMVMVFTYMILQYKIKKATAFRAVAFSKSIKKYVDYVKAIKLLISNLQLKIYLINMVLPL